MVPDRESCHKSSYALVISGQRRGRSSIEVNKRTRSSSAISPHISMKRYLILRVCTCSLIIFLLARGQDLTPANAFAGLTYNLTISPTETWVDTRIDLHPGDALQINAVTSTGGCSPNGAKTP